MVEVGGLSGYFDGAAGASKTSLAKALLEYIPAAIRRKAAALRYRIT